MSAEHDWQTLVNIAHAQAVRGISPLRALVAYRNLGALLAERASRQPERPLLLTHEPSGSVRERSYRELHAEARLLAACLHREHGLRRSDRIAIMSGSSADAGRLLLAAWMIGVSIIPAHPDDDDRRIASNLQEARARLLVPDAQHAARAQRIAASVDGMAAPVWLEALTAATEVGSAGYALPAEPARDDEAIIAFVPHADGAAGAVLNHYNLLAVSDAVARWNRWTAFDRIASTLPLLTVAGIVGTLLGPLSAGASTASVRFDPATYWAQISDLGATIAIMLPGQMQVLLELDAAVNPSVPRLRSVICTGGSAQARTAQAFEQRFGCPVQIALGVAEASGWVFQTPLDASAPDRALWFDRDGRAPVGQTLDVNEVSIAGDDGSQSERTGVLLLRGHNVMQGYHQRPDANRSAFTGGWLASGLLGHAHADASGGPVYTIDDSSRPVAERDGVPLSLADVDRALQSIPAVRTGVAVAFDNIYTGVEIGAYVVPEPGVHVEEFAILARCRQQLGHAKSPKVVVFGAEPATDARDLFDRRALQSRFTRYLRTRFSDSDAGAPVEDESL
ncbi:MAG: acyl--CoA ligase [Chloroflexi bacterium]|nr:acyl--CoA ligase [Chloroflexota bacterium]